MSDFHERPRPCASASGPPGRDLLRKPTPPCPLAHRWLDLDEIFTLHLSDSKGAIILANFLRRELFRVPTNIHDPAPREAVPPGVIYHENLRLRALPSFLLTEHTGNRFGFPLTSTTLRLDKRYTRAFFTTKTSPFRVI